MWEFIDKVIYINLDHREDRRNGIKEFFSQGKIPDEKIVRVSGVYDSIGMHGCVKSHIKAVKLAKESKWKRVLILEDDVCWKNFEDGYKRLEELISISKWDVCLLGGMYAESDDPKITVSFCSHAYIVNSHYYDALINNFSTGLQLRNKYIHMPARAKVFTKPLPPHYFNIDNYWIKLQLKDNWIGVIPAMCNQIESYSDITKSVALSKDNVDDRIVTIGLGFKKMIQDGLF